MDSTAKSTNIPEKNTTAENAKKEFKIIIMIILFILLIFLCLFVYNLIKCYLPKWRNQKREFVDMRENSNEEGNDENTNNNNNNKNRKIEMFDAI